MDLIERKQRKKNKSNTFAFALAKDQKLERRIIDMDKETNTNIPTSKKNWLKIAKITLWSIALGIVFGILLLFWSINSGDLPTFEQLENPKYDLASVIYDANKVPIGKYYVENRETIKFEELSPHVLNALVSTEDERFFEHSGIDIMALLRVGFKTILLQQESQGGGSTISQQLAKLLFERPNMRGMGKFKRTLKLINTKLKEWITAVKIEQRYTKEEIVTMYLNKFEFINGAHGIEAAAQTYFNKHQNELNIEEAAVLVGMLKNPSLYNPRRFPEKSMDRRNTVLNQMFKSNHISKETRDSLSGIVISMENFTRKTQSEGPAPYFRSELTKWLRNLFKKEGIKKPDGTEYNIYTDGLKIYSTIDLNYQRNAEEALREHMKWNQERFWNVWKNRNPWTYDADRTQREIRAEVFEKRVKASERYANLRDRYLGETIRKIRENDADTPFNDNAIKALMRISEKKTSWSSEVEKGRIQFVPIAGLTIENRAKHNAAIPEDVLEELKSCHVILKGPTTTPQKGSEWPNIESANVAMRRYLDLFANVRPVAIPEEGVDWMFFRENTEGAYVLGSQGIDVTDDLSVDFKVITEQGAERIIRMAFEYAKNNNIDNVTVVTKSNVVKTTDGRFSAVADRISKDYPGIKWEEGYIDIMTAKLIDPARRTQFRVMVMPNLYGDILTDEAAQMQGGVGTAGAANIGKKWAMFEAIHGSAPRMVEEGRAKYADPASMIRATSMLIRHIGYPELADKLQMALDICGQFEKKLTITGRDNGATGEEYTKYLLEWIANPELKTRWDEEVSKVQAV